ncbi:hypothetical protein I6H48_04390 [Corynebacterium amycolatum]|uniref:Uncharacterized protein n=1 Tax=Corynebacterium amycolatum TaxID=43765 RepID=A0AB37GC43_CORAY|nr:hypothetical protein [Corynebacterium amycolatum]QPR31573.1 hypothetical protein I6G95_03810 [Corynebacterium amycolatum]QQB83453.1 hypothetical protein I6H48_04390 [Corynebacterium amycolatum]
MSSPSQKTSYRGAQFLSAVLDLVPALRRHALESVEAEDFTTEPFRIVYKTLLEIPGLDTIDGREALGLALRDQSVANGSLNGEFGRGVQLAILDIDTDRSTGDMAFPLAKSLREDRFRAETCAIFSRLAKETKTAPLETIQASLQEIYQPEIDLFVRIEHPHRRLKEVA